MTKTRRLRRSALAALFGVVIPASARAQNASAPEPAPAASNAATPASPTTAPASPPITPIASEKNKQDEKAAEEAAMIENEINSRGMSDVTGGDSKINIYGFADFTYTHMFSKFAGISPYPTFAVGNLNLYWAEDLGDSWRTLAEVRFTYLPNGAYTPVASADTNTLVANPTRTDTTVPDYSDVNRPVKWGAVVIERAWLEKEFHPLLTVRVGQWLTPYGIWNVDHGSPVIIGVRRPFVVGEFLFPEHQTGVEVYGKTYFGTTQLGYHFTLSNGRGPIDTYQDLDNNKAIGGRLFARNESKLGTISVGLSGYRGKYTDRGQSYVVDSSGYFNDTHPLLAQYDELSLGADLKWEWQGLLVQAEAISNEIAYRNSVRPIDPGYTGGPPGYVPDYRRYGVYGLTGYRTPWWGIMPWVGFEYYHIGSQALVPTSAAVWGGLNVRPTARVVLKAQYTYSWFPTAPFGIDPSSHYNGIDLQAAWSF